MQAIIDGVVITDYPEPVDTEFVDQQAAIDELNAKKADAFFQQSAPIAQDATATLTIATLLGNLITSTSAAAISLTLPTGALTDAGILAGALAADKSFEWVLINLGSAAGAVTLLAGVGHTIVGNAVTAISTSSRWRTRKTAANTFVTYRVA